MLEDTLNIYVHSVKHSDSAVTDRTTEQTAQIQPFVHDLPTVCPQG